MHCRFAPCTLRNGDASQLRSLTQHIFEGLRDNLPSPLKHLQKVRRKVIRPPHARADNALSNPKAAETFVSAAQVVVVGGGGGWWWYGRFLREVEKRRQGMEVPAPAAAIACPCLASEEKGARRGGGRRSFGFGKNLYDFRFSTSSMTWRAFAPNSGCASAMAVNASR